MLMKDSWIAVLFPSASAAVLKRAVLDTGLCVVSAGTASPSSLIPILGGNDGHYGNIRLGNGDKCLSAAPTDFRNKETTAPRLLKRFKCTNHTAQLHDSLDS